MKTLRENIILPPLLLVPLVALSKSHAIPLVTLNSQRSEIFAGDSFTVDVVAQGVTDIDSFGGPDAIFAFGFNVTSSPELLFEKAVVSPAFMDDSLLFPNTQVAGSAFPGVSGNNILLASLRFKSTIADNFSVCIFNDLLDPNEGLFTRLGPLPYDMTHSLGIRVAPAVQAAPVSEPDTFALAKVGLGTLFGCRKKSGGN